MRCLVTGQVGVEKAPYLEAVEQIARSAGHDLRVLHVGQMMYREAPDVPPGRILNLPIMRLNALRRAVFKEILSICERHQHVLVNTHATFRWRHGLFSAFDFDQVKAFNADLYLTLLDNVESVHHRLLRDHDVEHTLKDVLVWREEELLATEIVANIARGYGHFFATGRGKNAGTARSVYRLMFEPHLRRVYLSYPMTHVTSLPEVQARIDAFREAMNQALICFDPADVDDMTVQMAAMRAMEQGRTTITVQAADGPVTLNVAEVAQCASDIMGQTYARDFRMIDQSHMIVSFVPELPDGRPALSSGVERELHHAFEGGKEVYVIWTCSTAPSPFVTSTATRVLGSVEEAVALLSRRPPV